jgi:hypothetical protein
MYLNTGKVGARNIVFPPRAVRGVSTFSTFWGATVTLQQGQQGQGGATGAPGARRGNSGKTGQQGNQGQGGQQGQDGATRARRPQALPSAGARNNSLIGR